MIDERAYELLCCQFGQANEISNLRLQLEDNRKRRFGRTSEQRRLLNNVTLTSLQWTSPSMTALTNLLPTPEWCKAYEPQRNG